MGALLRARGWRAIARRAKTARGAASDSRTGDDGSEVGIATELDHVFILCSVGAPEAETLIALGLREGSANTHPGQGTACRRFFFSNAYLELVWVSDPDEAQREPARATRLFERWSRRGSGASPFGIVLRPAYGRGGPGDGHGSPGESHDGPAGGAGPPRPPFPTWSYRPSYLPPRLTIEFAMGTPLEEPELFYVPLARRPDAIGREPTAHGLPLTAITTMVVGVPQPGARSAAAQAAEATRAVSFVSADQHLLTLIFGREERGRLADLRPDLPLVMRW